MTLALRLHGYPHLAPHGATVCNFRESYQVIFYTLLKAILFLVSHFISFAKTSIIFIL